MKKRLLIIVLTSLFSLGFNTSCSSKEVCDDMFEDCDGTSSQRKEVNLKSYKESNYTYDSSVTNKNGSMCYEIFVRSFYDSNNDGIGDLNGINQKLDYLQDLGIKTIWLTPIMKSQSYHGYDVIDYYSIHPDFGTMDDFTSLVNNAKEKNIDIMIDIVFNHSSLYNNYFLQSYKDYVAGKTGENSYADWYNWSETYKEGYSSYNGKYYECRFDKTMPDFNTENGNVRNEMKKILNFWVDKGVSGFRFDAVKYYDYGNTSYNVSYLTDIRDSAYNYAKNTYNKELYFVGECWDDDNVVNEYYKSSFDSFFRFSSSYSSSGNAAFVGLVKGVNKANRFGSIIEENERIIKENNPNAYSSYFITNHDIDRPTNSLYDEYASMAASLLSLMPGTPYIYYGEEISLKGTRTTSPDDQSDVKRRLPMIWSKDNKIGECDFPEKNRQDLNNYEQVELGVDDQLKTNYSLVNHYKKAINIRNKYSFIKDSVFKNLTKLVSNDYDHVLIYSLTSKDGNDKITVIHNFEKYNIEIDVSSLGTSIDAEISTKHLTPELNNGMLKIGSLSTVILK
jgi:alpha-amylase